MMYILNLATNNNSTCYFFEPKRNVETTFLEDWQLWLTDKIEVSIFITVFVPVVGI